MYALRWTEISALKIRRTSLEKNDETIDSLRRGISRDTDGLARRRGQSGLQSSVRRSDRILSDLLPLRPGRARADRHNPRLGLRDGHEFDHRPAVLERLGHRRQ